MKNDDDGSAESVTAARPEAPPPAEICQECGHDFTAARAALAQREAEIARLNKYKSAVERHLCKYDLADWLGCNASHTSQEYPDGYCECCETDKPHQHQLLARAESAEARVSVLNRVLCSEMPSPDGDFRIFGYAMNQLLHIINSWRTALAAAPPPPPAKENENADHK